MVTRALYIAGTGMAVAGTAIDVGANNIANMRTPGFKVSRTESTDLSYNVEKAAGVTESADIAPRPVGIYIGTGARVIGAYKIMKDGPSIPTGQPLDVKISGEGYFAINLPNGQTGYTRNGSFQLDSDRNITTAEGFPLTDGINIPQNIAPGIININQYGLITANVDNLVLNLGQINLVTFANPKGLDDSPGSNMAFETAASGAPIEGLPGDVGFGTLSHKNLEGSNAEPARELTDLIWAQRAYEFNAKIIKIAEEATRAVVQ